MDLEVLGERLEGGVGWVVALGRRLRGGRYGFSVAGEMLCAVRGVEAFWKNDNVGAILCSLGDFLGGILEVGGFVGACGQLDQGELARLLEWARGHGARFRKRRSDVGDSG